MNTSEFKHSWKLFGLFVMVGALLFVSAGCQTPQSPSPKASLNTNPLLETNQYGLSLKDAQDKAIKLEPGMSQAEVVLLLCKPDETSARTFGSDTSKPWNGVVWDYLWGPGIYWANRPNPHDALTIVFEKDVNDWIVNSWFWSGP
jgi:hypothetical protein